jgi:hypothetical protein
MAPDTASMATNVTHKTSAATLAGITESPLVYSEDA